MEERSLVSALKLAKSSVAPSEGETSESRFRREQAAKLADCILQTYKQYREESDKLIKDPDFLQEVKQVCFKLLDGLFVGYRTGRVAIIKVMALVARSRLNCVRGLKHIKLNQFEIFSFLSLQLVILVRSNGK